jgi:hypothetical protein
MKNTKSYHIYSIVSRPSFSNSHCPKMLFGFECVTHKGSILLLLFTGRACEAYSIVRGQCQRTVHVLGCLLWWFYSWRNLHCCVPYNLLMMNMKWYYTVEFKKKWKTAFAEEMLTLPAQWHHRIDGTCIIRQWKKQMEQLTMTQRMMFCGRTVTENERWWPWSPRA